MAPGAVFAYSILGCITTSSTVIRIGSNCRIKQHRGTRRDRWGLMEGAHQSLHACLRPAFADWCYSTTQSVRPLPCCTNFSARSFPAVSLRNQGRDRRPTTIVRHLFIRANSRISSLALFCSLNGSENCVDREPAGSPALRSLVQAHFKAGCASFLAAAIHCRCSVLS